MSAIRSPDSVDPPGTATEGLWSRWSTDTVLWAAVIVPYLAVAARWYRSEWFPVQDQAVLHMRMTDLFSGELPLLGAFSRYGWSHPGPVWFYVLAPFRVLGGGATWMVVGSVVIFGAGFATLAVLVRRRFGTGACIASVVAGMAAAGGGGPFALLVPWNPNLAFAWFGVFLVLCVSAASLRRRADLFAAGFVGSALVQLHVGYIVLVAAPAAVAAALLVRGLDGGIRDRMRALVDGRSVRWWIAGTALLWLPPIIDQIANGRDGNIWRLASFFLGEQADVAEPAGWQFATSILGEVTRIPLIGYGGAGEPIDPYTGSVLPGSPALILPLVALLGVAAVVALRRPRDGRAEAVLVAITAVGAALISGSRIVGDRWPYLFVWRYAVVWFAIAVVVVTLVGPITTMHSRRARTVMNAMLVVAVVLSGVTTIQRGYQWSTDEELRPLEDSTRLLSAQVVDNGPPDAPVMLVRFGAIFHGVGDGVLRVTDRRDWPVGMNEDLAFKYGDGRVVTGSEAHRAWLVTESSAATTIAEMVPGGVTLAKVSPLEPDDERRLSELQEQVLLELRSHGRVDLYESVGSSLVAFTVAELDLDLQPGVLDELAALNADVEAARLCRCAVVDAPPGTPHHPEQALELAVNATAS